jgi:hypothetical protein
MHRVILSLAATISVTLSAIASDWGKSAVERFGFSWSFPGAIDVEDSTESGVRLTTYTGKGDNGAMCLVGVAEYPVLPSVDGEFTASRDNFIKAVSGKLLKSERINFKRGDSVLPASKFDAASANYRFRSIIVIENLRVYLVVGGVPIEGGSDADSDRCVDGFKLTAK